MTRKSLKIIDFTYDFPLSKVLGIEIVWVKITTLLSQSLSEDSVDESACDSINENTDLSEDENSEESEEGDDLRRRRNLVNDHNDDEDESYSDDEVETEGEEEEELSEGEMRLLNMIKINKIDVKINFAKVAFHLSNQSIRY